MSPIEEFGELEVSEERGKVVFGDIGDEEKVIIAEDQETL